MTKTRNWTIENAMCYTCSMQDTLITDAKRQAFIAKHRADTAAPSLISDDPASAAWRAEQARVDADIEGLHSDPETEALMAQMRRDGLSPAEKRARLDEHFKADMAVPVGE